MRLWHVEMLRYLPNAQLIAQKRECDAIWKDIAVGKKTNHILINYISEYSVEHFFNYYLALFDEFVRRGFSFNFSKHYVKTDKRFRPYEKHHDLKYLVQCFYNLQEKYDRGQKDFDIWSYKELELFVRNEVNQYAV